MAEKKNELRDDRAASDEETRTAPGGGLSGVAVRRPVFTAMMMFGLIVLGIFGFRRLPIDQFPDVDIPVVAVQTIYPGASPETIEREVTRRLEEAFNTVEGVDRITSSSLEGSRRWWWSSSWSATATWRRRTSAPASTRAAATSPPRSRRRWSRSSTLRRSRSSRWRSPRGRSRSRS